jgi:aromatic ring hydroxylase
MQSFTITLTLTDEDGVESPSLNISSKGEGVTDSQFALLAKTFKDLTIAPLEAHLEVSNQVAGLAKRCSDADAFDEED